MNGLFFTGFLAITGCFVDAGEADEDDDDPTFAGGSGGSATGGGGGAGVSTGNAAPWEMGSFQSALFATDPDNDSENGDAVLMLSTAEVSCNQLLQLEDWWDLDELTLEGSGIFFVMEYDHDGGGRFDDPEDWAALYMSGYGYNYDKDMETYLATMAWNDGYLYLMGYYSGTSWLRITQATESQVSGEYFATYWTGSFSATDCGDWREEDNRPHDTYDW